MERLSNKYLDVQNELKIELSSIKLNSNQYCAVKYMEIPWFPGGQVALFLVADKSIEHYYKLIEKTWDSEYDSGRFSTGVFNLDRLCIREREIQMTIDNQKECQDIIHNLLFFPKKIERQDYILLDGVEYELQITTNSVKKNYKWKIASDDIKYFERLIAFMKRIAQG